MWKSLLFSAILVIAVMYIVYRVPQLKGFVVGSAS